jgi:hypothetical protein
MRIRGMNVAGADFNAAAVEAVAELSEEEITAITEVGPAIAALQAVVGTYEGGSLTDVASDVDTLQTVVGAASSVIGVYQGGADIGTDLGAYVTETAPGLTNVADDVAALQATVDAAGVGLSAVVADHTTAIGVTGVSGLIKAVEDLQTTVDTADIGLSAVVASHTSQLSGLVAVASVTYAKTDFPGNAKTVPDEVRGVTVSAAEANAVLVLTLPTGASNLGDVLTLTVSLTGNTPGSLNVVYGGGTLTAVANGQHTFHCTAPGVWKPMRNAAEIVALQTTIDTAGVGLSAVVAGHTSAIGDAQSGLVKAVDDVEAAIGSVGSGLIKAVDDLEAWQAAMTPRSTKLMIPDETVVFALLDDSVTYLYNETPAAAVNVTLTDRKSVV